MTQNDPVQFNGYKGQYSRGASEACPNDHLTDCYNCIFPGPNQVSIREGLYIFNEEATNVLSTFYVKPAAAAPYFIYLDSTSKLYKGAALLATWAGADDFAALQIGDKVYITPKKDGRALAGEFLYIYDVNTFAIVKCAGSAPFVGPTLTQTVAGHVDAGLHKVAYSFEKDTGFLTPPSAITEITAAGAKAIEIETVAAMPAGYVAWVFYSSRVGENELFKVPGGRFVPTTHTIVNVAGFGLLRVAGTVTVKTTSNHNLYTGQRVSISGATDATFDIADTVITVTSATEFQYVQALPDANSGDGTVGLVTVKMDFYDTSLVDSADYVNDLYNEIPSCSALKMYRARLVCIGPDGYPDNTLVSRVSDYESINQVTGIVSFPSGSDVEACNGGLIIRNILYVTKPNAMYSTLDNGREPYEWPVDTIDAGIGAFETCISNFASELSAQDILDSAFMCHPRGLMHFIGYFSENPLTWKIESIWREIQPYTFPRMAIAHDPYIKRVYILDPDTSNGRILMMDYSEGLGFESVKWSIWTFDAGVFPNLTKVQVIPYIPALAGASQITFLLITSTPQVYSLDATQKYDGEDPTSAAIDQYVITPGATFNTGWVHIFDMLKFRFEDGFGDLNITLYNHDLSKTSSPRKFVLTTYAGQDLARNINFVSEELRVKLRAATKLHYFWLLRMDIYGTPYLGVRPALTQSL